MKRNTITIDFKETQLVGDILPADSVPDVIFLHGAGTSDRMRYDYLRLPLVKDGIASCAFDFIGHGETGGQLESSSLEERTDQASSVIDTLSMPQPIGIVATSGSADVAIRLTQFFEVNRLVLLVPAVQDEEAWETLNTFDGKLLIIAAGDDQVVPREIVDQIYAEAKYAASRQIHVVEGASHQIQQFLTDPANKEEFDKCYKLIKEALS